MTRFFSRAEFNPLKPEARAICDRCGCQFALSDLSWQFQYAGSAYRNRRLLVCKTCRDEPSIFLKTPRIPADPPALFNSRTEPYAIDEKNDLNIRSHPGVDMFMAFVSFAALIDHVLQVVPSLSATSGAAISIDQGLGIVPAFATTSGFSSTANVGTSVSSSFAVSAATTAIIEHILAVLPTFACTSGASSTPYLILQTSGAFSDTSTYSATIDHVLAVLPTFSCTSSMSSEVYAYRESLAVSQDPNFVASGWRHYWRNGIFRR